MNLSEFTQFPDDTQLWVYGFANPLSGRDLDLIRRTLDEFLSQWMTHGQPVAGAYAILDSRFVLLAGRLESGISGCSIDSSVRNFKVLRDRHGLDGLDRSLVFYRNRRGDVSSCPFTAFQKMLEEGEVDGDSAVFDTTIGTLRELRSGRFELKFKDAWHARTFSLPAPANGSGSQ